MEDTPAAPQPAAQPAQGLPPDERFAAQLRGFGPVGLLAIVVILAGNFVIAPLSTVLALVWAKWSRTPWREIGYVWPQHWVRDLFIGILFGGALKLLMKSVVMPLLGAAPLNPVYHFLVGNTAALPGMIFTVIVLAGFGEETLFRGYMFERLGKLFGSGAWAKTLIVLLTAAWFGLVHYPDQGLAGAEQATIVGLVFGAIYALRGQLWLLMIAHAAFDLVAVALIYWNLEYNVAHLFFK